MQYLMVLRVSAVVSYFTVTNFDFLKPKQQPDFDLLMELVDGQKVGIEKSGKVVLTALFYHLQYAIPGRLVNRLDRQDPHGFHSWLSPEIFTLSFHAVFDFRIYLIACDCRCLLLTYFWYFW